jgi:electron transfer flavoprotein alpha subunit
MSEHQDGIRRRNPRRERDGRRTSSVVEPARSVQAAQSEAAAGAAPRIDPRLRRRERQAAEPASTGVSVRAGDVTRIDQPSHYVLMVPDLERGRLSPADRITLGAARMLADADGGAVVLALMLAADEMLADDAGRAGVDRVVELRDAAFAAYDPQARAAAAVAIAEMISARHIVLSETRSQGGDLARRIAATLGGGLAVGVVRMTNASVTSVIDAGRREAIGPAPRVVAIDTAIFPAASAIQAREARPLAPPPVALRSAIRDEGLLPMDPRTLPLAEAELVLSAGDGVTDWDAFHALAAALPAAEAGSRVVCDAGHLPRSRQVGASGTIVSAQCYIAAGISGSPQHLHGIADCRTVIAVNTDLHAAMVARAELAIIADAQAVMPALTKLVEERRHVR